MVTTTAGFLGRQPRRWSNRGWSPWDINSGFGPCSYAGANGSEQQRELTASMKIPFAGMRIFPIYIGGGKREKW